MNWQEIIVGIIALAAVVYLVRYFINMTKSHNCDDCGLMDMKKESDRRKAKLLKDEDS